MATQNHRNLPGSAKRSGQTLRNRSLAALVSGAMLSGVLAAGGALGFIGSAGANLTLSGKAYQDPTCATAANGTGVAGVAVNIYNYQNVLISTVTTGADGTWQAPIGQPGPFRVEFTNFPSGLIAGSSAVQLQDGAVFNQCLMPSSPATPTVAIGDRIWKDVNGNGIQDAGPVEAGIAGVQLELLNANGTPVRDAAGAPRTATTDANGNYLFTGLTPGAQYIVRVVANDANKNVLNGLTLSPANAGNGQNDSKGVINNGGGTVLGGAAAQVSVTAPQTGTSFVSDIGYTVLGGTTTTAPASSTTAPASSTTAPASSTTAPGSSTTAPTVPTTYSLGNLVFLDNNRDGQYNGGDAPVAGAVVELLDNNGNPVSGVAPQTTQADGRYLFTGLAAGTYRVRVTRPAGSNVDPTAADNGFDGTDSDIKPVAGTPGVGVTDPIDLRSDKLDVWAGWAPGTPGTTAPASSTTAPASSTTAPASSTTAPASSTTAPASSTTAPAPRYSLGDVVFLDVNRNGVQDAGDTPVAGARVELLDGNGNPVAGVAAQTTGADGQYLFTNLPAGSYRVRVTRPAGSDVTATAPNAGGNDATDSDTIATNDPAVVISEVVNLTSDNRTVDSGWVAPAPAARYTLGDRVFIDTNGNGQQDAGEPGVEGARVDLLDANGNVLATQTSGANGSYQFTNLLQGTYRVRVTRPAGSNVTPAPSNQGDDATDSDTLPTGTTGVVETANINLTANNNTVDSGWVAPAPAPRYSLGDFVFLDNNRNGVQDAGDTPVAGARVELLDGNGNPVAGVPAQTTGANGQYLFENLPAGNYRVRVTRPAGSDVTATAPNASGNDATDSDTIATNDPAVVISDVINLTSDNRSVDSGWVAPAPRYSLGDFVFLDNNRNGVQDAGDTPVAGARVELLDGSGNPVAGVPAQTTGANGQYLFENLLAGNYRVRVTRPAGSDVTATAPNAGGNDATDSDTIATNDPAVVLSDVINLTANNRSVDSGWVAPAPAPRYSLGDTVFLDNNRNGVQDAGDTPVAGATVQLLDGNGNPVAGVVAQTTGADGRYLFTNLPAGTYRVRVTRPAGSTVEPTTTNAGGNDATDSDTAATLTPGVVESGNVNLTADNLTVDSGWVSPRYTIGDTVFLDNNRNGVFDAGDTPVEGAFVSLLDSTGRVLATTTTGANGQYGFANLPEGTYRVRVTRPAGSDIVPTTPNAGSNDNADSDTAPTGTAGVAETGNISVTANVNNVDSGWIAPRYTLGDTVWFDADRDGRKDDNEDTIAGVLVELFRGTSATGTPIATQTTGANGQYLFTDLEPGQYTVRFTRPNGTTFEPTQANALPGDDVFDSDAIGTGSTAVATVNLTGNNLNVDSGWVRPTPAPTYNIGNLVTFDNNGDGIQDSGDTPFPGVRVELLDANGNVVRTTTTNAAGVYEFVNVPAGTYRVRYTAPDGSNVTPSPVNATADTNDSDGRGTGLVATTDSFTLSADNQTIDQGFVPPSRGSTIGDLVFLDSNRDGIQDAGDTALPGVTVELIDEAGNVVRTTTTDANGRYTFTNVPAGNYRVRFTAPDGRNISGSSPTGANTSSDNDSNGTGTGRVATTPVFRVSGTGSDTTIDQGFVTPAPAATTTTTTAASAATYTIGDLVFIDTNGDGIQDAGDTPLSGVTVELLNEAGATVRTTTTDPNGRYSFTGVPAGNYRLRFTAPDGQNIANPSPTGANTTPDNDSNGTGTGRFATTGLITVNSNNNTIDQGFVKAAAPAPTPVAVTPTPVAPATPATIATTAPAAPTATTAPASLGICLGDKIFSTKDAAAKDGPGIKGVTVVITNTATGAESKVVTGETGEYKFCSLTAGTYTVKVTPPAGATNVYNVTGKPANEATVAVVGTREDIDFGFTLPGVPVSSVKGTVAENTEPPVVTSPAVPGEGTPSITGSNTTTTTLWAMALMMIGLGLAGLVTDRRRSYFAKK